MNTNKENPTRDNLKSRIPVPLTRLPNHRITKKERPPLETLNKSKANIEDRQFSSLAHSKNDITFKRCTEQVITHSKFNKNWDSKVYKDSNKIMKNESNLASEMNARITDNDIGTKVDDKNSLKIGIKEKIFDSEQNNHLDTLKHDYEIPCIANEHNDETTEPKSVKLKPNKTTGENSDNNAVTPATLIEHKGIKKIKKSLKRPHSRELQRLSPDVDIEIDLKVKRRLLFDSLDNKVLSSNGSNTCTKCPTRVYTSDIFQHLQTVENKPRGIPFIAAVTRTCLINWLIKLNGSNGNPAVIQVACWYLDSYLSSMEFPLMKLQVAAAACFWIAQKQDGRSYSASKMVFCGSNAFTAEELRATEIKVLKELGFPRQPVVPQEYITYLSLWCSSTEHKEIELAATFLCLTAMMVDKTLCTEYPSVIAAASMKSALFLLKKTHLMDRLIMCPEYQKCLMKFPKLTFGSLFRCAVRTISSPTYEYNILLKQYGGPPYYTSQKIVQMVMQHNVTVRTQTYLEE